MIKRKLDLKKLNKKKLIIALVILNLLIIGGGATLSAYKTNADGNQTFQVARIIFNNNEVNSLSIDLTNLVPGTQKNLSFNVANYSGTNRSDVTISYKLLVRSYGLIPAQTVIKNTDTNQIVLTCNSSLGTRGADGMLVCESSVLEMSYNANKQDNYKAIISVSDSNTSSEYANQADYFEIVIDSWQKQS